MNTVYNTLLMHKTRIVTSDLCNVYVRTHAQKNIFTHFTCISGAFLQNSLRRPGLLEGKTEPETGCGSQKEQSSLQEK